jgi:hypothetical protein
MGFFTKILEKLGLHKEAVSTSTTPAQKPAVTGTTGMRPTAVDKGERDDIA